MRWKDAPEDLPAWTDDPETLISRMLDGFRVRLDASGKWAHPDGSEPGPHLVAGLEAALDHRAYHVEHGTIWPVLEAGDYVLDGLHLVTLNPHGRNGHGHVLDPGVFSTYDEISTAAKVLGWRGFVWSHPDGRRHEVLFDA